MTVLIVEDEPLAIERLQLLLLQSEDDVKIAGIAGSIESSVSWLQSNPHPDVILMDIELSDGQSFSIFDQINVKSPVIFTTSYDSYAIRAFKVNSIDYLLKPIKLEDLKGAMNKLKQFGQKLSPVASEGIAQLLRELRHKEKEYRERFLVKTGQRYLSIETGNIAYFFYSNRVTYLKTWKNEQYYLDYILDELEELLSPKYFFRVNRQYLVHIKSVKGIHSFFNHKLRLTLQPTTADEILVSRERATEFKKWMGK